MDTGNDYQDRNQNENPYSCYYGTGAPKRGRSHSGLVLLVVVVVLISATLLVIRKYDVELQQGEAGLTLSIKEKGAVSQEEPEALPEDIETDGQEVPDMSGEESPTKIPAVGIGTGAELEISNRSTEDDPEVLPEGALTLQEIYQRMIPSVVSILTTTKSGSASGTGIVMTTDGYIITNNHVVENGSSITVVLQNNDEYGASLVGADSVSDLAVLKIDARNLTAAEFGDSTQVQVGDEVVAIGDPLGIELRGTMTNGIISAINRDLTVNGRTMTLLQTNAQLNNGNSGGPLVNQYGQVIGINTMKMGSYYSSSVEGLGFAIPIATAKPIIDELIEQGYVSGRPALGIQGDSVPAYAQAYYHMPNGVYVSYVYENSDASAKGLAEGDIITAMEGESVTSMDELNAVKNQYVAGDVVTLTVYRSGKYYEVSITLMDQNDAD